MIHFPAIGIWRPGQVHISWTQSSRQSIPQVEAQIEQAWQSASARPGVFLFDGPMCRLESLNVQPDRVDLTLSRSSYKIFLGTNAIGQADPTVRANPVGVSSLLVSRDDFLLMGRRNASVALYPDHVHPFAGSMEPADDLDAFDEARRELQQELSIGPDQIQDIVCTGIAEEPRLMHIELVFAVRTSLSRGQVESQLDQTEHRGVWTSRASQADLEASLKGGELFTPFGRAALLLWGRMQFADAWLKAFNA